jgi:hypothetical protein
MRFVRLIDRAPEPVEPLVRVGRLWRIPSMRDAGWCNLPG